MRAVNLIPVDQRRGARAAGRSGGAVYLVLGGLALVVVLAGVLMLANRSVARERAELATVTAQANAAEAVAGRLAAYTQFAAVRRSRVETVVALARSRFDWAATLHEIARTIPADTHLSSLRASANSSVNVQAGATDPLRSALALPAVELQGCTSSQRGVARLMSAMRRLDGVQRVSLSSADKGELSAAGTSAAGPSAGAGGSCPAGRPKLSMTVFFRAPAPAAIAPPAGAASATTAVTPAAKP